MAGDTTPPPGSAARREERHHLLNQHRHSLTDVEGQHLLDVVLHLVEAALDGDWLTPGEEPGAHRLADVDVRLAGLGPLRAITSGPKVLGDTGSRWRPTSFSWRATQAFVIRPSIAEATSTRPDQFSGVSVQSMPAWWTSAMLTNRWLRSVVSRPALSRKHRSRTTVASLIWT